ncbi:MAG: hypothetical protein H6626_08030 [Pseudobdellovibrionaceae bacterium]|nr:hypothetical protein [Bdellovibrionales bacterium]USN46172.1 MAG: hypothetical protein H6626_08030 [Pseudobdellovibrionaceae bacterium]
MGQAVSFLTQSKFYSPAFNGAIFDGPVRIYFAQYQETLALKFYFCMQKDMRDLLQFYKDASHLRGRTVYVMLYPTTETFERSFDQSPIEGLVANERWGEDHVVGVCNPNDETDFDSAFSVLRQTLSQWKAQAGPNLRLAVDAQAL